MLRFLALGILAAGLGGLSLVVFNRAESQPQAAGLVVLQPTTPGTSQTGHANISGTMKAGQFQGSGAGLTGVNADQLDGMDSTALVALQPTAPGTAQAGNINLSGQVKAGAFVGSTLSCLNEDPGGAAVSGVASSPNSIGGFFLSSADDAIRAHCPGGDALQVISCERGVVIGEATDRGVVANAGQFGGHFEAWDGVGVGVFGRGFIGGRFETTSTTGTGVYGSATSGTGDTYGVFGISASPAGIGVYGKNSAGSGFAHGVYGDTASTSGRGVFGRSTAVSGTTYGGYFQTASTNGFGVAGKATALSGNTFAGHFENLSSSGTGVYGSGATYGGRLESVTGYGVFGYSSANNGANAGVYGASNSSSGYGVYSAGNFGASGTKAFRIDHPFDPTRKYLLHYAAESPLPQNFYVGNVVTDDKGYAWVELPDYFSEINTNFKYQLTVVDDGDSDGFVMAKISKKILANRFQIRTSKGNVEVSWRVDADRNDLYVRAYKPKDVLKKQDLDVGTYQHPELYGEPPEKGLNYRGQEFGNPGQR